MQIWWRQRRFAIGAVSMPSAMVVASSCVAECGSVDSSSESAAPPDDPPPCSGDLASSGTRSLSLSLSRSLARSLSVLVPSSVPRSVAAIMGTTKWNGGCRL